MINDIYLEEELVSVLDSPKNITLPNWLLTFSSQSTEDTIPEMGFQKQNKSLVILSAYGSIYSKVED